MAPQLNIGMEIGSPSLCSFDLNFEEMKVLLEKQKDFQLAEAQSLSKVMQDW